MSTKIFHLELRGYVGGPDFNIDDVNDCLDKHRDQHVDVLIDSTGGSLATGLSICSAFRLHGDVSVHLTGLNASAATIASMGAKRVTMDGSAMYLVHKTSLGFFRWASMNSDEYAEMIADVEKTRADLDKMDQSIARLYAGRCASDQEKMLGLMKAGAWLSADEALDLGFVDEITDRPADSKPQLTASLASAMALSGMMLPPLPIAGTGSTANPLERLLNRIEQFFTNRNTTSETMPETNNPAPAGDSQLEARVAELEASLTAMTAERDDLQARLAAIEAAPDAETGNIVENHTGSKPDGDTENDAVADYCNAVAAARDFYNSLP